MSEAGDANPLRPLQSALHPAGPSAQGAFEVTLVLAIGAGVLLLFLMLLLAWSLRGPRVVRARWWLWGGGLALPIGVLGALFIYSERHRPVWRPVPPPDALVVSVTGHMWWWDVRYEDRRAGLSFRTANELRLPAGRPVYLALSSRDVIHSFWVPALAGKMDMVPGRMQHLLVQADSPGRWRGQCAEFCGAQHARMSIDAVALSAQDFEAWARRQMQPAAPSPPASGNARVSAGREAFLSHRCDACHAVRGLTAEGADGGRGPDLTHVGGRLSLGAATLANSEQGLRDWVAHTQALKPGVQMPAGDARLPAQAIDDIAAWLAVLQ
ncbi:c-type cytochrome [Variovorax dokdonensis]|uniref:C-type cytochrome n=1 Tax=Variovorax dokdonensis TaxID=344883 RepID=A0ABT7N519_9BURK|nr:c-type cytochrome [Variovorax dokdonensis]MDM0043036.1 c-type cytochrome [Variovorax dokdonensis]